MKARFVKNIAATVAQNDILVYDNIVTQNGITQANGQIQITIPGTYLILVNITTTASSADAISFSVMANDTVLEGATASTTPVSGDLTNISLNGIVTVIRSLERGYATLSIKNTGAETSVNNASVIIMEV